MEERVRERLEQTKEKTRGMKNRWGNNLTDSHTRSQPRDQTPTCLHIHRGEEREREIGLERRKRENGRRERMI